VPRVTVADPRVTLPAIVASVMVLGLTVAWAFLSMRVVMDVGGSCADGGPYVSAQSCPGGAGFIGIAIPLMLVAAFVGSFAAATQSAPNLLVPMWIVLFLSLGWNFLEYGLRGSGGGSAGWVVCGVVFWLMGLPALFFLRSGSDGQRQDARWWPVYVVAGAIGAVLGVVSFDALT
jgi:hypothetical protein